MYWGFFFPKLELLELSFFSFLVETRLFPSISDNQLENKGQVWGRFPKTGNFYTFKTGLGQRERERD